MLLRILLLKERRLAEESETSVAREVRVDGGLDKTEFVEITELEEYRFIVGERLVGEKRVRRGKEICGGRFAGLRGGGRMGGLVVGGCRWLVVVSDWFGCWLLVWWFGY